MYDINFGMRQKVTFQFKLKYALDYDKTHLFQHLFTLDVDPIDYYRENLSQVKVGDDGKVNLCYVQNLPVMDIQGASEATNSPTNVQ